MEIKFGYFLAFSRNALPKVLFSLNSIVFVLLNLEIKFFSSFERMSISQQIWFGDSPILLINDSIFFIMCSI